MSVPADGLTLEDKRATTQQLLRAGADIQALNTVRKHLSAIKGGWLAAKASGPCRTFAISDVVGDDLSVIGSGPTVPDASTFRDALDILLRFGGEHAYPASVVARITNGAAGRVEETPKAGDPRLARAQTSIIGGRRHAMDGAVIDAESRGYHVIRVDDAVVGEARAAGPSHLRVAIARTQSIGRPACIVSSGETIVRVTGDGKGGRNQEFALACAGVLSSLGATAALASVGTDGIDGPTDAAGAIVDHTTIQRARALKLQPEPFLERNDAYRFFAPLHDLIITGPTGTNVGDLQIILIV
jgi:hydroxypyruvate reductase